MTEGPMGNRRIVIGAVAGAVGGAVAIGAMQLISDYASFPLMLVPFATSIVLVMGTPEMEPSQPRALVGGHLLATLVGLVIVKLAGPSAWAAAGAVGLAMVAMHATRAFHPPAGIDPLIVVVYDKSWDFLLAPVAIGAGLLAVFAFGWHNFVARGSWPQRWW
jgi:CBS-domain-containing membrane protein